MHTASAATEALHQRQPPEQRPVLRTLPAKIGPRNSTRIASTLPQSDPHCAIPIQGAGILSDFWGIHRGRDRNQIPKTVYFRVRVNGNMCIDMANIGRSTGPHTALNRLLEYLPGQHHIPVANTDPLDNSVKTVSSETTSAPSLRREMDAVNDAHPDKMESSPTQQPAQRVNDFMQFRDGCTHRQPP